MCVCVCVRACVREGERVVLKQKISFWTDFCVLSQSGNTPDDHSVTLQTLNMIKHNILLKLTLQSRMKDTGGPVLSLA